MKRLFILASLFISTAHAATQGGGLPTDAFLQRVVASLSGPWAIAICVVGIIATFSVLIFRGGEIGDLMRGLVYVAIASSVILTVVSFVNTFFGAGAIV